jgi:hypothetical protein
VKGIGCGFTGPGDQLADPQLGPLQDNGGPSPTMALPFGSPAINAADGALAPPTDQRGVTRPRRGGFDVGAYENRAPAVGAVGVPNPAERTAAITFFASPAAPEPPGSADPTGPLTFSWTFDDGATAAGASVTHAFATAGVHSATVTMTEAGGPPVQTTTHVTVVDTKAPAVGAFSMSPRTFAVGPKPTPVNAAAKKKSKRTGTTFRYKLSEAGRAQIVITRPAAGRKVKRRCVKATRKNRKAHRCTRYVKAGVLTRRKAKAGNNKLAFTGRVGKRKLAPGRYRATITATDAAGNRSKPRTISFKIVKR